MNLKTIAILASMALCFTAQASEQSVELKIDKSNSLKVEVVANYTAGNTLCKQIQGGVIYPHVAQRVKKVSKIAEGNILKFDKKIRGFCNYKLNQLSLQVSTGDTISAKKRSILTSLNDGSGIYELDCIKSNKSLECTGDSIRLDSSNSAEVRINLL